MTLIDVDVVKAREVARVAARTLRPLRTERTTRSVAKDLAGAWWDEATTVEELLKNSPEVGTGFNGDTPQMRSRMFRRTWPDRKIYIILCWPFFYKVARDHLVSMLRPDSGVSPHLKERIHEAILEDRNEKGN